MAAAHADCASPDAPSTRAQKTKALGAARTFRKRFVDTWASDFLTKVDEGARVDTYRGLALMTRGALRVEGKAFEAEAGVETCQSA